MAALTLILEILWFWRLTKTKCLRRNRLPGTTGIAPGNKIARVQENQSEAQATGVEPFHKLGIYPRMLK